MDYTIIDAHSHLWLYQDTEVDGLKIKTTEMVNHCLWGR